jgi:hypothetical protein
VAPEDGGEPGGHADEQPGRRSSPPSGGGALAARLRAGSQPYPLVLLAAAAAYPFLGFMNANHRQLDDPASVLRYAAVVVVVVEVLYVGLLVALRRPEPRRVAVALAAAVTAFFLYAAWNDLLDALERAALESNLVRFVVWLVLAAVATTAAARASGAPGFRQWVLATLLILCGVNVAGYLLGSGGGARDEGFRAASAATGVGPEDLQRQPNVYFFLLDAYARNDVLDELVGIDNSGFHDELRDRGFEVADEALASYPITFLSAMSTFAMGYPVDEPADLGGDIQQWERYLQGDSPTVERFHALGYEVVHSPPGTYNFARCNRRFSDVCITPDSSGPALRDVELTLIDLTPVSILSLFEPPRTDPLYVVDQLAAAEPREPFFLFAHILHPHWPYTYREDCTKRSSPLELEVGVIPEQLEAYRNDLRCLNDQLLEAVDRIVADDPEAIILLTSDHGPEFTSDWFEPLEGWDPAALRERFGTQNALRLPEQCRGHVQADTPLVHDFAIVFACLEGREPELVDYRAFLWLTTDQSYLKEIPPELLGAGDDEADEPEAPGD